MYIDVDKPAIAETSPLLCNLLTKENDSYLGNNVLA